MTTQTPEKARLYEAAAAASPSWDGLPRVATELEPGGETLRNVYFDTADLRLAASGVSLRRGTGGTGPGWSVLTPAVNGRTEEHRFPAGRGGRTVPRNVAALVRVHARGEPIGPVAQTTVRRSRRHLLDRKGALLARVVADDISAWSVEAPDAPTSWSEIEIELVGGGPELLRAVDERLAAAGARRTAAGRQAVHRLLGDRIGGAGRKPPRVGAKSAAGEVVVAYLWEQVAALKAYDPGVRRGEDEAVHDMRVTVRRIRSALRAFNRTLDPELTRPLGDELRWLGGVLGEVRDREVLRDWMVQRLAAMPPELVLGPVRARIDRRFSPALATARRRLLAELDGERYFRLLDELDAVLRDPPLTAAAEQRAAKALLRQVRRGCRRLDQRLGQAVAEGDRGAEADADAAFHEARKTAKRTRYAAEVLRPALRGRNRKLGRRLTADMRDLQGLLGIRQDTVMARGALRELGIAAHLAGENAFTFGALHAEGACEARGVDAAVPAARRRIADRGYGRRLR